MDRLKKHEDELDFFALEMRSRQVLLGGAWRLATVPALIFPPGPRGLFSTFPPLKLPALTIPVWPAAGLPIALYGFLCDYGSRYDRPLYGLLITIFFGGPWFWFFGSQDLCEAIGVSVANTFGILGFRKDFVSPKTIEGFSHLLVIVAGCKP